MNYSSQRGLTIIEMVIAIGISGLLIAAVALFLNRGFGAYREQFKQVLSVEQARNHLARINAELQNATNVDVNADGIIQDNEKWLIKGTANELKIYTNIDSDPELEIVHYTLTGTTLTRGVIQPEAGSYPPASEVTTTIDTSVRNIEANKPFFSYYALENPAVPLSEAAVTSDSVYRIDLNEVVDTDPSRSPKATDVKTSTVPRLGKKGAAASAAPTASPSPSASASPGSSPPPSPSPSASPSPVPVTSRLWPLLINLPAEPQSNINTQLTWTDPGSGAQSSQVITMSALNTNRLAVYSKGYQATINYQGAAVGSNPAGWYAYIGPIYMGSGGAQQYYKTDQVPLAEVCKGSDLAAMIASCPSRTVTQGTWQVTYQPILTYTDPTTKVQDYVNNITTTYGGASPTPVPQDCPMPSNGLISHWKFDDGSGTVAANTATASAFGTLQNGTAWTAANKAPTAYANASALQFDGADDDVAIANSSGSDVAPLSWAGWVYPTASSGNRMIYANSAGNFMVYLQYYSPTNNFNLVVYTTTWTRTIGNVPMNSWTHIALVLDDVNHVYKIYVNGSEKVSTSNVPARLPGTTSFSIGSLPGVGNYFQGVIDDVRLYNRALSHYEVLQLATRVGSACLAPYPSPTPTPSVTPSPSPSPSPSPINTLLQGLAFYWKLDEGSGNTANDSSGSGNLGTLQNGLDATGWSTTKAPTLFSNLYALVFDGVNDYVSSAGIPDNGGDISISAWVYPTAAVDGTTTIVSTMLNSPTGNDNGYSFYLTRFNGAVATIGYDFNTGPGNASGGYILTSSIPDNQWTHVALVYNNQSPSIYVNGSANNFSPIPVRTTSLNNAKIGGLSGSHYFKGGLDDVRVYNRALSATEVQSLAGGN